MAEKTLTEVEAAIAQKNAAVDALKVELRALNRTRDALLAAELTAKRLASMPPAEREAMKAALSA